MIDWDFFNFSKYLLNYVPRFISEGLINIFVYCLNLSTKKISRDKIFQYKTHYQTFQTTHWEDLFANILKSFESLNLNFNKM